MFDFNQLERIQIEITNKCQASCPMCPRNIHGGLENPLLLPNEWSFENFINIITPEVLEQIKVLDFCGDFGDPIINKDLIKMCQYVTSHAPNIELWIHTNGSAHTTSWWERLAQVLPTNHTIVFALDGLEDTHNIYRIGTDYNKILDNAQAFIMAGGNANWCFIRFKHNQHQVLRAKELASQLGFKNFLIKDSKRFSRPFPVVDKSGDVIYHIEQPDDSIIQFVGKAHVKNHQQWLNADKISCVSDMRKEVYIDAHYLLSPCCMIGAFLYTNYDVNLLGQDSIIEEGKKVQDQVLEFPKFNLLEQSLQSILATEQWQTMWQKKWQEKSSSTCIIMCGPNSPYISIDEQKKYV